MMQKIHLINISPSQNERLKTINHLIQENDAVVFYEDAVLFCKDTQKNQDFFSKNFKSNRCYVLEADVIARGINKSNCLKNVQVINYDQWVELTEKFDGTHSWN